MIDAFLLALGDLGDRRVLGILARSLLLTLLIFVAIGFAFAWALRGADPCAMVLDESSCAFDSTTSGFGAVLLAALGFWLLFPAVAIGVISGYVDRIVAAVEARHYPSAAAVARPLGVGAGLLLGLRSSLRVLLYNLVALPFYLLLLVTGVGTLALFLLVNGAAVGRDLGELVAARHLDASGRRGWIAGTRASRLLLGAIVSFFFLVPLANLLAPVLGAAMTAHLFHRR